MHRGRRQLLDGTKMLRNNRRELRVVFFTVTFLKAAFPSIKGQRDMKARYQFLFRKQHKQIHIDGRPGVAAHLIHMACSAKNSVLIGVIIL